jgi:RimJ/RimL family protein N-acetyltransferase
MRIRFLISAENARAIAMAEALGFRPEPRPPCPFVEGTPREALLNYFVLRLE